MFRKDLIELLSSNPMTITQVARLVKEPPGDVVDGVLHLFRSLKHTDFKPLIEPARCRACGFEFSDEKLTKPSKCPECHSTWIQEPKISVAHKISPEAPRK